MAILVAGRVDGHEITMPFEQGDFVQAKHAQLGELAPLDMIAHVE